MTLRDFLRAAAIIGPLPNNIVDGDPVDAVPVMNDFNWIVSQVNANVPPLINAGASGGVVFVPAASVGGSANAITLTPTPAIAAYAAGQSYRFVAKAANTGAVTVNTSSLGARQLTMANGNTLIGGELQVGGTYDISDNGSRYSLVNAPLGSGIVAFTPSLTFGGAAVGMTYGTQSGQVITIGNLVLTWILIELTAKGSSTGLAAVNLGVVTNALVVGGGAIPMGAMSMHDVTFSGMVAPAPQPGLASLNFTETTSGGALAYLTDTAFSNTSRLAIFLVYSA